MRASVGEGGKNKPADVAIVQDLLNRQPTTMTQLKLDGLTSQELTDAIKKYQEEVMKSPEPDGRVDAGGGTYKRLLKDAAESTADQLFGSRRASLQPTTRTAVVEDLYKKQFGSTPAGLTTVVSALIADVDITDIRWAAYMMATVKRETGDTFQPIEEWGKGKGKDYGDAVDYVDKTGKKHSNVYYGRGYVQITWLANYLKLSQALGLDDQLAIDPAKALEPANAYKIMSYGMRNGSFTGKKLSDYISGTACDYPHARRIINGMDHAYEISAAAEAIEVILRVAVL
ncbi:hypothetical protein [Sphingomonas sp.]|uniref:hypothetical protein n=1 Tax=Sphingomonas sp. TaxID=28214 RepID=UPI003B39FD7D